MDGDGGNRRQRALCVRKRETFFQSFPITLDSIKSGAEWKQVVEVNPPGQPQVIITLILLLFQIPLADVWLSDSSISDVAEVTLDSATSFVIGWPISNAVITFNSSSQRTLWWDKLSELIQKERSHTPQSTSIQITYFDQGTNFEHVSVTDNCTHCQKSLRR